jgi:hypothetical protein
MLGFVAVEGEGVAFSFTESNASSVGNLPDFCNSAISAAAK